MSALRLLALRELSFALYLHSAFGPRYGILIIESIRICVITKDIFHLMFIWIYLESADYPSITVESKSLRSFWNFSIVSIFCLLHIHIHILWIQSTLCFYPSAFFARWSSLIMKSAYYEQIFWFLRGS